ncbi:fungal-specific transcription factor domain-containing protein [Vararia minispora EC-137]|uniref:Fungal-specific transcription factor domain-containing protein n=1 Tax=Vararia minispora EC-137 TaxID=1314806 RepID=A0ACB8QCW6_9AGAM|nr:fungal-specific transcription factor domain-containing protein [Vararia minispora EC-137]
MSEGLPSPKIKREEPPKPRRRPGRVPVSCAECRRLKLKCDRKVPCETCSKRGCAEICPNGSLATGKLNNKYVLANTTELHARIDRMVRRIRELEHGLSQLQATVSTEIHPLLRDDHPLKDTSVAAAIAEARANGSLPLRSDANTSSGASSPEPRLEEQCSADSGGDEFIDSFGTLSIGAQGGTRFYGATARGEYLLQASLESPQAEFWHCTRLDPRILAVPFPEATGEQITPDLRDLVLSHLPPLEEVQQMCQLFLEHATCFPSSITSEQLTQDIIGVVYHAAITDRSPPPSHCLSLLFIVCAISKLLLRGPDHDVEAFEFFVLSRVALTFDSPITTTTVMSVQAMCYMAQFLEMRDVGLIPTGCSKAWMYLGLASQMAHGIGLHVNSSRFKLDVKESEYRSRVFWHLFAVDTWTSFTCGRPPSVNMNFVDCDLPPDDEEYTNPDGTKSMGFSRWSYLFHQLLYKVLATAFASKPPPYSTILDLDRKLRDFAVPDYLRPDYNLPDEPGKYCILKRWLTLSHKEWGLLNIHRAYFAQALKERPHDPLKHKFGLSVMALYRSAYRIVEASRLTMKLEPQIFYRSNMAPSKTLSAAIVMCLLVCAAPSSNLAPPSMEVLEKAISVIEHGVSNGNMSAKENMAAIHELHRQAKQALCKRDPSLDGVSPLSAEELDRLCGQTSVITHGRKFTFSPCRSPQSEPLLTYSPTPTVPSHSSPSPRRAPMSVDNLLNDYTSAMSAHAHVAGVHVPELAWTTGVPMTNTGMAVYEVGYQGYAPPMPEAPQAMPHLHDSFGAAVGWSGMPYVLDASWQDFVQQLGF